MELYVCGFNAHRQLCQDLSDCVPEFKKILRSPHNSIRCGVWSSTVIEDDGDLVHRGYHPHVTEYSVVDGPPVRNVRSVFGDTGGVLGALTTDGSLYILRHAAGSGRSLELKRHHFSEDSFIQKQDLAIEHLVIADNEEVCIITNSGARSRCSSGSSPGRSNLTPRLNVSPPASGFDVHIFASFEDLLFANPPKFTTSISSSVTSLQASSTGFAGLTSGGQVLTFGSALHPQVLGRTPTPSDPAGVPTAVPFLGGIPIRKIAISGWLAAALSEDNDLYIWGGQAINPQRISALPTTPAEDEVKLVDIDGGLDVTDVGVGSGHILALTANAVLWAIGDGEYGQLGTGRTAFESDWVKVNGEWEGRGRIIELGCGVWCSWLVIDTKISQI